MSLLDDLKIWPSLNDTQKLALLTALVEKYSSQSHYQLFGLDEASLSDEQRNGIRKSYINISKIIHPDKVPEGSREVANILFQLVNTAQETLSDPVKERDYIAERTTVSLDTASEASSRAASASAASSVPPVTKITGNYTGLKFPYRRVNGYDLSRCIFICTKFYNIDLTSANLNHLNCTDADFEYCTLDNVDARNTNFKGASFDSATTFDGADLRGAQFQGAVLFVDLSSAVIDETTLFIGNTPEEQANFVRDFIARHKEHHGFLGVATERFINFFSSKSLPASPFLASVEATARVTRQALMIIQHAQQKPDSRTCTVYKELRKHCDDEGNYHSPSSDTGPSVTM